MRPALLAHLRRHITTKLSLLVTLAVVLAILAAGLNFDAFLRQSFLDSTRARMQHAYQRLDYNLKHIESELLDGVAFASEEESLIASIELVNHYQDKASYNAALLDEEKKTLALELLERVKFSLNSDMALYDQNDELVAFAGRQSGVYQMGYVTFVNGQSVIQLKQEAQREFQPAALPADGSLGFRHIANAPNEAASSQGLATYQRLGDQLLIKSHHNVLDAGSGRRLAHLELSFVLDSAYFLQLSKDMDISLIQTVASPWAVQALPLDNLADFAEFNVLQTSQQYWGVTQKSTLSGPVYFTVRLDKARENALINAQRLQIVLMLLVIAACVLLFMRYVLRRGLVQPLGQLMGQIRQIKQGNYAELTSPATGDELEEIGHSVNTLALAVAQREQALENARQQADYLSRHDALTGLPNQRFLGARIEQAIEQAQRTQSQLAVLFLDLDQFKLVNDTLGHPIGDQLLAKIAQRFQQSLRSTDTLARVGGDEFNMLIENISTRHELAQIVDHYLTLFQTPFECGEHQISITTSIGVARYPQDGADSVTLLKNADLAVYAAKERGRNTSCFYMPELSSLASERAEMIHDLKMAIGAGDQFELYYQPKVSATSGRLVSAEALIRWHKPGAGLVPPGRFIALAEETRQIIPMGDWIIGQACRDLAQMMQTGVTLEHISVNVSNVQLRSHDLLAVLREALQTHGLVARQLELEITESYIAQDTSLAIASLHAFRKLGLALAIDDFGTGYSSLSYLKKLPFTRLKIDKSFVDGLPGDPDSGAIARAIIGLAKNFGLSVTAEGVERADQLAFLQQAQCDEIQGYFYAKPMPLAQFIAFCQANQAQGMS
jgi:diguanylate cyclase (GGDEF)-like protein